MKILIFLSEQVSKKIPAFKNETSLVFKKKYLRSIMIVFLHFIKKAKSKTEVFVFAMKKM